jgi:hypothetical protein
MARWMNDDVSKLLHGNRGLRRDHDANWVVGSGRPQPEQLFSSLQALLQELILTGKT